MHQDPLSLLLFAGFPPFGEGEIQGLFQDFQGPFSVDSRDLELGKIFENGTDLTPFIQ
jgi:hypothetical protein